MKEYKLSAWPDLPPAFHRTTYRRMLSDMSQRYMTVPQLMTASGATRLEVRLFLQMLAERGLLCERAAPRRPGLQMLGGWIKRALQRDTNAR